MRRLRDRLLAPPAAGAGAVGLVFAWASFEPTLLPRPATSQGVITALALLIGYGLGGLVIGAWLRLAHRQHWSGPAAGVRRLARWACWGFAALTVLVGLPLWLHSQNAQRVLVTMPSISASAMVVVALVTAVVVVVLVVLARLVTHAVAWLDRWLGSKINRYLARGIVVVLVAAAVVVVTNQVVIDSFFDWADATFSVSDQGSDPGVVQPTSATVSGGPNSLVSWSTLGRQGRSFVAGVSSPAQLQAFAGPSVHVISPVRVYAGLESAPTDAARAALAVRDLEHLGGFHRKVLVVGTATGSGWLNPVMSSALEYQWAGDSAIVSMQYSYLPSWIAFLTDKEKAAAAGSALAHAVYDAWSAQPAATRPRLILFGESLGSFGAEAAYHGASVTASLDGFLHHADAVALVGPTNANPVLAQVVAARHPSSPPWRPVYGDGQQVLEANAANQLPPTPGNRMVYLGHASDPVRWWNWNTLYAPQPWEQDPRGPDVPTAGSWFPIVTFLQVTSDLIQGFSAPAGHGHNYNDAWAQLLTSVAAPTGWTPAETSRLAAAMVALHGLGGN